MLWIAIQSVLREQLDEHPAQRKTVILYTGRYQRPGGSTSAAEDTTYLVDLVRRQFGIELPFQPEVVYLNSTIVKWLDAKQYPRLTLVLQTFLGGTMLAFDVAVMRGCTDVIIDTVGLPGCYPLLRALFPAVISSPVVLIAYVHYPTITAEMFRRVRARELSHVNDVAASTILSYAKLAYYRVFAFLYVNGCLRRCNLLMGNSTWTCGHLTSLLKKGDSVLPPVRLVYPPVDVARYSRTVNSDRANVILSVGQFRPEKNHPLQLRAFASAVPRLPADTRLVLLGGVRNDDDRRRVDQLKSMVARSASEMASDISQRVEFVCSAPIAVLESHLQTAAVGLHTMTDEHFGIVVVEYMAAGLIPLAHDSAGPKMDIVREGVDGFLRRDERGFADAMIDLFRMKASEPTRFRAMQRSARERAESFGDEFFVKRFLAAMQTSC